MPRILVVDDEPDLEPLILQKFRRKIREGEVDFVFARNGAEALEKLSGDPSIDVILSDINMPVMDGLTLLTHLAGIDRLLKTVIVSAYDDLQNIRTAMNRGAFDFITKPIDFQDLEHTLRKTLDEVASLRESIRHREELEALQSELNLASRIQQSILPRVFPVDPRYEAFAEMIPARVVGGDFYDLFEISPNHIGFAVGDVSGKGIAAAIYMAVCRTLLRATVLLQHESPHQALLHINRILLRQSEGEMYVTLFYGVIDLSTGLIDYCIAGHPTPWIVSQEHGVRPGSTLRGNMLGLLEDPEIGCGKLQLLPGDLLLTITDGVADAEGPDDEHFSNRRLVPVLKQATRCTARELAQDVFRAVKSHAGEEAQNDDITALCLRYLGK